ncbi:dnaJ homolog subfamily C member 3 [Ischnura elegans]|uniref:dnaJ homolog subfamily C member 3 n=1 Tax=Ischnura elegans TaxID=197161 RepID=UPI001ED89AF6|nr:dnaJ homolog subfamily C member 3 [Ischnura elegans]
MAMVIHSFLLNFRRIEKWFFIVLVQLMITESWGTSQDDVNKHLEMGRDLLSRGQLQDALSHYHAAVEGDPNNHLTYFKRGTVYLALGKSKVALSDVDKVLELKPDFIPARLQRANILLKQGDLDESQKEYERVLLHDPENEEAYNGHARIYPIKEDIARAKELLRYHDYHNAIAVLGRVIEVCAWDPTLRELRADVYTSLEEMSLAIADVRAATRLRSDNTAGLHRLAKLLYQLGDAESSLKEVRECLKLDPDHKECFTLYKQVKKLAKYLLEMEEAKSSKSYKECSESAKKVLKLENKVEPIVFEAQSHLCKCLHEDGQITASLEACGAALALRQTPDVYCDRAEAYIAGEMYDDAIHDYHRALEIDSNFPRAKEGIQRAQKLQKQSERRDYYKILDVKRSATKKEIIKAYRKAAQKWHPDNFQGDEKKIAEKRFIDIAAAKEVLTDPEKRQRFDNGEDPLDPESGNQYGGANGFNPFQHFHQFHQGGSPFQFKFHFN